MLTHSHPISSWFHHGWGLQEGLSTEQNTENKSITFLLKMWTQQRSLEPSTLVTSASCSTPKPRGGSGATDALPTIRLSPQFHEPCCTSLPPGNLQKLQAVSKKCSLQRNSWGWGWGQGQEKEGREGRKGRGRKTEREALN